MRPTATTATRTVSIERNHPAAASSSAAAERALHLTRHGAPTSCRNAAGGSHLQLGGAIGSMAGRQDIVSAAPATT
jgi:hypothetical protein